ncbi:VapB-type antitoxin [Candidatus Bathyarchaeota archaeon]|nr:VapB-type antitoxin [Candidatus Bathyarchaeota archaeon]
MTEATTIRVSKKTAETLENIREKLKAESLDETIQLLVKQQRKTILESAYGVARGKIKPYTEEDRGEDRN